MVKDAYYFIIPLLLLALALFWWGFLLLPILVLGLAVFVGFFFRNPDRVIPNDPDAIISPADGKVVQIAEGPEGARVSIFLSVFDVHVNRAPWGGTIQRQDYHQGRFRLAFDERASVENERVVFTVGDDRQITFALIAGLIARRIVPWRKVGEIVAKGDRIALIRFGSRADVFLPPECELVARVGDRVRAGSSLIGRWRSSGLENGNE
ncbi:MAG TPA: phosphatidylserine decarboxylase [Acidobacteriota bacterium]|nr:phosphatidylserine decarboxylase [Acidobacteriota bacterium]